MIPAVMKGVQLLGHGGSEKLVWNEAIPTPVPKAGEVLVRVLAAGVNNTDINTRLGWYSKEVSEATDETPDDSAVEAGGWSGALSFPLIQGSDLCGRVVALGEGVGGISLGARVTCPTNQPEPSAEAPTHFRAIGSEFDGAFAQYCCVRARQIYNVSSSPLSDIEIAAMPCAFGTALNLLTRAGVGEGDRVLIAGSSGGVGLAAVALASLKGAAVVGIARKEKQPQVLAAGARGALGRGETPPEGSFDAVIDLVGGPDWPQVLEALVPGGRYATSGAIAGPIVTADLRTIYLKDLTLYGCSYTPPEVFAELVALMNEGALRPLVARTYPLREIARAQQDFAEKKEAGKLVLLPPD